MPSTKEKKFLESAIDPDLYGAGGEPPGEPPGVLGTGVEIGGVSPVLEPWQGESNIEEARARSRN